ncbi:MAG: SLC13 family permease [Actinobacteria bacterium]|nr:SLC13 family permease [Actinomycetota bacterium]
MSPDAWFTLAVIVAVIAALASERVSAPVAVLGGVTALLIAGVVDAKQAFSGFSSEAPVTIAALYVLAGAAESTGLLDRFTAFAVGQRQALPSQRRPTVTELARLLLPAGLLSALVYNTPLISLLAPQVTSWARRSRRPPSWYLLGLNAAVLLGGMVTAIGTTTNVVVSGLLVAAGQPPLGLFEITRVGLPVALVGLGLLLLLTPLTAPTRQAPSTSYDADGRDFTLEMVVVKAGPLVGKTVGDAGLRNLEGVFLVEVGRGERTLAPVTPEEVLVGGDRLVFAGNVGRALDLHRISGLASAESPHFSVADAGRRFYEVVVASGSTLVGSTLKEAEFRSRFGAAVVAIHRSADRVPGKLGTVRLHSGDVLLVLAGEGFEGRRRGNDFVAVAPVTDAAPVRRELSTRVGLVLVSFLAAAASGVLDVLQASLLAAFALLLLRVMTAAEARQAVDLNVVVTLAASFGLGAAMTASGLAAELARLLVAALDGVGRVGVLAGVLLATVVVTQVVTNNAAAIVMFPIALASAEAVDADVRTYALAVAVGASMSFLTPIGYQTNLVVQGLGGYRFRDFLPIGTILVAVCAGVAVLALAA